MGIVFIIRTCYIASSLKIKLLTNTRASSLSERNYKMREIKFKGKALDSKIWVYGSLVIKDKLCFIIPIDNNAFDYTGHNDTDLTFYKWFEIDPKTLSEYTGISDIYENDIVEGNPLGWTSAMRGVVVWLNDGWYVSDETERDREKRLYGDFFGNVKRLGNLFDDKVLLEGKL